MSPCRTRLARGKESAGSQFDSFGAELVFCFGMTKADCGHRAQIDCVGKFELRLRVHRLRPAFDEPQRMGTAGGERLGGSTINRGWRSIDRWAIRRRKVCAERH